MSNNGSPRFSSSRSPMSPAPWPQDCGFVSSASRSVRIRDISRRSMFSSISTTVLLFKRLDSIFCISSSVSSSSSSPPRSSSSSPSAESSSSPPRSSSSSPSAEASSSPSAEASSSPSAESSSSPAESSSSSPSPASETRSTPRSPN